MSYALFVRREEIRLYVVTFPSFMILSAPLIFSNSAYNTGLLKCSCLKGRNRLEDKLSSEIGIFVELG